MHKRQSVALLMVTLALILVAPVAVSQSPGPRIALGSPKPVAGPLDPNAVVSHRLVSLAAVPVTAEERAQAVPMKLQGFRGEPTGTTDRLAMPQAMGKGGEAPGRLPSKSLPAATQAWAATLDLDAEEQDVDLAVEYYSGIPPFNSTRVNSFYKMWVYYPWTTMGKLYFRIPGDETVYMCTAAVGTERTAWTAGHCVYTPGTGWHTNFVFEPAWKNGFTPYGQWLVDEVSAPAGWLSSAAPGDRVYDLGMVELIDQGGNTIADVVGHLAFKWGVGWVKHWHTYGFPDNLWGGKYLNVCAAATSRTDDGLVGDAPIAVGCDMREGSSGGPRLQKYIPYVSGNLNFVNGITSYAYLDDQGNVVDSELYSPYFGQAAKNLHDWGKSK